MLSLKLLLKAVLTWTWSLDKTGTLPMKLSLPNGIQFGMWGGGTSGRRAGWAVLPVHTSHSSVSELRSVSTPSPHSQLFEHTHTHTGAQLTSNIQWQTETEIRANAFNLYSQHRLQGDYIIFSCRCMCEEAMQVKYGR